MFALSQLVDIPHLFHRLDALPQELATARQELWAAYIQIGEAQREYNKVRGEDVVTAAEARGRLLTWQEEHTIHKHTLASLHDEMSALRAKVDLITALTMGRQETIEGALLRQLLEGLQLEVVRGAPGRYVQETATEAEPPPGLGYTEAGDPVPF